ncbi:MAG TPA: ABC transporter substrate-binding protein [Thermodesulfobacteriota bacterium]|nr:ABC transporter substrate-binding protein [Thermodesulfobacteriota bacterium]
MGTKRLFAVYLGLALLLCLMGSSSAQQRVVKIGAIYPLTGNLATTGLDCKRGVEMAVEIINGKYDLSLPLAKTEGLPDLGGAKIEVIFGDSKGDPRNGMAEAERLVTQEKVVAVIGAYQSAVTKTASQATERLKIPFVNSDSTSPTLTERGFKYFFRPECTDTIFARNQFEFLQDIKKKTGMKLESVALLYENTEWGANVGKEEQKYAKEFQYKILEDIPYSQNATDVSSEVGKLIKGKPDVLLHASYITDAILYTKTFKELGFAPKGLLTMAGYLEPDYLKTVKADGNYMVVRSTFALDLAKRKPLVAQVNDLFKKKFGMDMSGNAARSFTAPFVVAEAINRAKSTDPEPLTKALTETNIPGDQIINPWKGIKFDPKTHQNIYATGILVQTQNEQYFTVWPFDMASKDVIWPFPGWKK